jgi:hypothetical protein
MTTRKRRASRPSDPSQKMLKRQKTWATNDSDSEPEIIDATPSTRKSSPRSSKPSTSQEREHAFLEDLLQKQPGLGDDDLDEQDRKILGVFSIATPFDILIYNLVEFQAGNWKSDCYGHFGLPDKLPEIVVSSTAARRIVKYKFQCKRYVVYFYCYFSD